MKAFAERNKQSDARKLVQHDSDVTYRNKQSRPVQQRFDDGNWAGPLPVSV